MFENNFDRCVIILEQETSGRNNKRIQFEDVDDGEKDEGKETTVENKEQSNAPDTLCQKMTELGRTREKHHS